VTTFGPYPATVLAIHDGDTARLLLDVGFGITFTSSCRFYGINAPELSTQAGKDALAFLETVLHVGGRVTVLSHGFDKYGGRFDGSITLPDGRDVSTVMLQAGQAVPMP
jgi:micrococcal nuclease